MHEIHKTRVRVVAVDGPEPSAAPVVVLEKEKGLMVQASRAGAGGGDSASVVLRNTDSLGSLSTCRN